MDDTINKNESIFIDDNQQLNKTEVHAGSLRSSLKNHRKKISDRLKSKLQDKDDPNKLSAFGTGLSIIGTIVKLPITVVRQTFGRLPLAVQMYLLGFIVFIVALLIVWYFILPALMKTAKNFIFGLMCKIPFIPCLLRGGNPLDINEVNALTNKPNYLVANYDNEGTLNYYVVPNDKPWEYSAHLNVVVKDIRHLTYQPDLLKGSKTWGVELYKTSSMWENTSDNERDNSWGKNGPNNYENIIKIPYNQDEIEATALGLIKVPDQPIIKPFNKGTDIASLLDNAKTLKNNLTTQAQMLYSKASNVTSQVNSKVPLLVPNGYVIDTYPGTNTIAYAYKEEKMTPDFMFLVFRLKTHTQLEFLKVPKPGEDGYHNKLDPRPPYLFLCYNSNGNIKWNTTSNDVTNWELPRYLNMITSEVEKYASMRNPVGHKYNDGVIFTSDALLFNGFVSANKNDDNSWTDPTSVRIQDGADNPNTVLNVKSLPPVEGYTMDKIYLYRWNTLYDYIFKVYINNDYVPSVYFMTLGKTIDKPSSLTLNVGESKLTVNEQPMKISKTSNLTSMYDALFGLSGMIAFTENGNNVSLEDIKKFIKQPLNGEALSVKEYYRRGFLNKFFKSIMMKNETKIIINNGSLQVLFFKQLPISVMNNTAISVINKNNINLPNLNFESLPDIMFLTYNAKGKVVWNLIPVDLNSVWEYPQYLNIPARIRQLSYNYDDKDPNVNVNALEYQKDQVKEVSKKNVDNSYGTNPPNGIPNVKNLPNIQHYQIDSKYFYQDQGVGERDYFFKVYTKHKHEYPTILALPPIGEIHTRHNKSAYITSAYIFATLNVNGQLILYGLNGDDAYLWENVAALGMYTPEITDKNFNSKTKKISIYSPDTYDKNMYGGYEYNTDSLLIKHRLKIPDKDDDNSYGSNDKTPNTYPNITKLPPISGFNKDTTYLYMDQAGRDYMFRVYRNANRNYPTSLNIKYDRMVKNGDKFTYNNINGVTNLPNYIFVCYNYNGDFMINYTSNVIASKYWELPKYYGIPSYVNDDSYSYSGGPKTLLLETNSPLITNSDSTFNDEDRDNSYGEDKINYLRTLPEKITINLKDGTNGNYQLMTNDDRDYVYKQQAGARKYIYKVYRLSNYKFDVNNTNNLDVSNVYGINKDVDYLFVCITKVGELKIYSLFSDSNTNKPAGVTTRSILWEYPRYLSMPLDQVRKMSTQSGKGPDNKMQFNNKSSFTHQLGLSNKDDENSHGSGGFNSYTYVQRLPKEFSQFKEDTYIYIDNSPNDHTYKVYINKSVNPNIGLVYNFPGDTVPNYLYVCIDTNGYPVFNTCYDDTYWENLTWAKKNNKNAPCIKDVNYSRESVDGSELTWDCSIFGSFSENTDHNSYGTSGNNTWPAVKSLPDNLKLITKNRTKIDFNANQNPKHLYRNRSGTKKDFVYKVYKNNNHTNPDTIFPPGDVMRDNTKYLFLCYNNDGNIVWNRSTERDGSDTKYDNRNDVRKNSYQFNNDSPTAVLFEKEAWLFRMFNQPGADRSKTGEDSKNSWSYSRGSNCIANVKNIPDNMYKKVGNEYKGYKHFGDWCYRHQSGDNYIFKIYQNVSKLDKNRRVPFTNKESYRPRKKQYSLIPNLLEDMDLFESFSNYRR